MTCPRCYRYVHGTDRACPYCQTPLLEDDFTPLVYESPRYVPAADRHPDEDVLVYCCRCPLDEAFWHTTPAQVEASLQAHVRQCHPHAPGSPVWVEDEDWWLCAEDDVLALHAVRLP